MNASGPAPNASPGPPELLVIVVNYRTPELTLACLDSLADARGEVDGLRAVVVDNGSGDGSAERLAAAVAERGWGDWLSLCALDRNVGFARGVNHGHAQGPAARWVLLLNSDAQLHPGALGHCCARMREDASIGALSCRVLNADGSVQNVARRFPTPLRLCAETLGLRQRFPRLFGWADVDDPGWDRSRTRRDVDWLGGAFLLLRGELVRRVGLLDGDFFFYGEDIELCHRFARAGFRRRYEPDVTVSHVGAASSEESSESAAWRRRQLWSARYLVLRKCHGRVAESLVRGVDRLAIGLRASFRRWLRGADDPSTRSEQDLLQLLRSLS